MRGLIETLTFLLSFSRLLESLKYGYKFLFGSNRDEQRRSWNCGHVPIF